MRVIMRVKPYLLPLLTAASLASPAVLAADISGPPTLAASARAFQIQRIDSAAAGLLLRLNEQDYLLLPTASLQWENGSAASRDALQPGLRVRVKSRLQGELAVIEQLTILAD